uniref:Uncharacterized protein n=1 Tax=Triticum urartu TaxID=4572 RepID=A0A8R7Q7R8_TRIUA
MVSNIMLHNFPFCIRHPCLALLFLSAYANFHVTCKLSWICTCVCKNLNAGLMIYFLRSWAYIHGCFLITLHVTGFLHCT